MVKTKTEERLLQATLSLISEKGYLGTTTKEIALEAGVTEVTLFRHFGSKEHLFQEVLNRYTFLPRLKELLPELEKSSYNFEDALFVIGTRFFETLKERKSLVKIMTCEINVYPEKIKSVYSRFINEIIQVLAGYLKSQQEKGVLRPFSPDKGAEALLGMIFSFFKGEEIIAGRDIDRVVIEKTIREFVNIFVHGTLRRR